MQSIHKILDIGPSLFQGNLNIWDQLVPTIALQNLAFWLLGRKEGFWFSRLICLMIWFYWVKSQQHVFVFLWLIPDSSVLTFNFGNSFVSHVQQLDDNPTAVELSGNLSGRIPAPNFCATINSLSNQFLVTFERLRYSRTWYFLSFFHSFMRLQIPKSCPRTISHTCKSS